MTLTVPRIEALVVRIQNDFLETPAFFLTAPQAERRYDIDGATCEAVLNLLVDAHVLKRSRHGIYLRFYPRLAYAA